MEEDSPATRKSVFHTCAQVSVWALPCAVLAGIPSILMEQVAYGTVIFVWIGVLCGFIGLTGIFKHGWKELLWKSLAGILIPLIALLWGLNDLGESMKNFNL